jgi:predicted component of type VI protein secretion system
MTRPLKPRTSRLAPRLVVENGLSKGDEYIVRKPVTLIGRNESCDLIVSDPLVSRRHCQISWDGVYCTVEDLGSTNGTFVNGRRVTGPVLLSNGDMLGFADTVVLAVQVVTAASDATVVSRSAGATGVAPTTAPAFAPPPPPPTRPAPQPQAQQPMMQPPMLQQPANNNTGRYVLIGLGCLVLLAIVVVIGNLVPITC